MKIGIGKIKPEEIKKDILVLGLTKEQAKALKKSGKGAEKIAGEVISSNDFDGDDKKTYLIPTFGRIKTKRILLLGLGEEKKINFEKIRKTYSSVIDYAKELKLETIGIVLPKLKLSDYDIATCITEGLLLNNYSFDKYRKEATKDEKAIKDALLISGSDNVKKGVEDSVKVSNAVMHVRDMINECTYSMTPEHIAQEARKTAKQFKFKCTIFYEKKIKKLGMGL